MGREKLANTADAQQTRAVFSPFPTFLVEEKDMGLKMRVEAVSLTYLKVFMQ